MKFIKLFEYYSHTLDVICNYTDKEIKNLINQLIAEVDEANDDAYIERDLSQEEIFEYIKKRINIYKGLPDKVTLFRLLNIPDMEKFNPNNLGKFYSLDWGIFDEEFLEKVLTYSNYELENLHIVEVIIPKAWIDFETTIKQNILFPSEQEISIQMLLNEKDIVSMKPYLEYFPDAGAL